MMFRGRLFGSWNMWKPESDSRRSGLVWIQVRVSANLAMTVKRSGVSMTITDGTGTVSFPPRYVLLLFDRRGHLGLLTPSGPSYVAWATERRRRQPTERRGTIS